MTRNDRWLALILLVVGGLGLYWVLGRPPVSSVRSGSASADPAHRNLGKEWVAATSHYQVSTRATMEETTAFGAAAEALYRQYADFFAVPDSAVPRGGLKLRLHKDAEQFGAAGGDVAIARSFYRSPVVHAYVDAKDPLRVHPQLLATTLQLNNEVARLPRGGWLDHGLAYYYSASRFEDWTLTPGQVEARAYPATLLPGLAPSGDAAADFAAGKLLPLRSLVAADGGGSAEARALASWTLVHFLMHADGGKRAPKLRQFVAAGGAAGDFEAIIGPFDVLEPEWYGYVRRLAGGAGDQKVIVVD